jgi:hypothetical protein
MTVSISGTGGITFNDSSVQNTAATGFGFKNRIINGAMVIDQRNAGAAVTSSGSFPVDRFRLAFTMDGACSAQQDTVAPAGFVNSLKFTTTTADTSLSASQVVFMQQRIEGNNLFDLGWGTASAQTVTLSFWVRSSLTGTFGGSISNSAENRSYPFTYAISSANTWEQKSITISGDTSGTWLTTNGIGIRLNFSMGAGSSLSGTAGAWAGADLISATGAVSVIGTLSATWQVTGVQLEKGSTATSFDYRPYGTELALCQRYYYKLQATANNQDFGAACAVTTTVGRVSMPFPVTMRDPPSAVEQSGTASNYQCRFANTNTSCSAVPTFSTASVAGSAVNFTVASGLTAGQGGQFGAGSSTGASAFLAWSAEL